MRVENMHIVVERAEKLGGTLKDTFHVTGEI